jgi:hypothetical protein
VTQVFETRSMANNFSCFARCEAVRPGHSVRPKIRLTESGTDLITILRCIPSFKTVLTSRNIIVFKIFFRHPSLARSLVPLAASCPGLRFLNT